MTHTKRMEKKVWFKLFDAVNATLLSGGNNSSSSKTEPKNMTSAAGFGSSSKSPRAVIKRKRSPSESGGNSSERGSNSSETGRSSSETRKDLKRRKVEDFKITVFPELIEQHRLLYTKWGGNWIEGTGHTGYEAEIEVGKEIPEEGGNNKILQDFTDFIFRTNETIKDELFNNKSSNNKYSIENAKLTYDLRKKYDEISDNLEYGLDMFFANTIINNFLKEKGVLSAIDTIIRKYESSKVSIKSRVWILMLKALKDYEIYDNEKLKKELKNLQ